MGKDERRVTKVDAAPDPEPDPGRDPLTLILTVCRNRPPAAASVGLANTSRGPNVESLHGSLLYAWIVASAHACVCARARVHLCAYIAFVRVYVFVCVCVCVCVRASVQHAFNPDP